jgi:hypothetical protein
MQAPADPLDAGLALAAAFDLHGISYALGGALAYGVWGIPRATLDVDVNVFLEDRELPRLGSALSSLGIEVDAARMAHESASKGLIVVRFGMFRVDVFTPSIAFSREAERTRRQVEIEGRNVQFLSPEALCVFKLRPKDLVDLERLIEVQGAALDVAYVRAELASLMGEQDERVQRWDQLTAARH